MEITAAELAQKLGCPLKGDAGIKVTGINDLKGAGPADVSFILGKKYAEEAKASSAIVILSDSLDELPGKTVIKVENAKVAYVSVINIFYPEPARREYQAAAVSISKSAVIGNDTANDAGYNIMASATDWTYIEIPFSSFAYETWGAPLTTDCSAPGGDCAITTVLQHVKQIQFQTFGDPAAANRYPNGRELWIDDIELY